MPDYITDPELLNQLGQGTAPAAPAPAASTTSERQYVSDPDLLRSLDGRPTEAMKTQAPIPEAPLGNRVHAAASNFVNTMGFNIPRNVAAATTYGLSKLGVPGFPDTGFEDHYQKIKRYDEDVSRQNPKSALAGTAAGVAGAVTAAPALIPEALAPSMSTLFAGGLPAVGRSAVTAGGITGASTYADTHDAGKAAGAAALGAVAGPVADKIVNVAKPFYRKAETLLPREVYAAFGSGANPGTPGWWRNEGKDIMGQVLATGAGGAAGYMAGQYLPTEYGSLGAAAVGGIGGRSVVGQYQRNRRDLGNMNQFYAKGNKGSIGAGVVIPQALNGLLGD